MGPRRHLGATLVKDSAANLRRFVEGNLAHGIDHLLVVHDGPPDPDVRQLLEEASDVTLVVADDVWWRGDRPVTLNARQRAVANLARVLATELGFVDWLFFLDGDEVAVLDRQLLADLPADVPAVRLLPLESVTTTTGEVPSLFKHLLEKPQLRRLHRDGLIAEPRNQAYFRGHVTGKTGLRPSHDVRSWVHAVVTETDEKVPLLEHPGLRHLHFESPSYDEFVRKWTALATSGPPPAVRAARARVLETVLAAQDAPAPTREEMLRDLYAEAALDDVEELEARELLVRFDVTRPTSDHVPLTAEQHSALAQALDLVAPLPKQLFLPSTPTTDLLAALGR
jgi:hypothetical protein